MALNWEWEDQIGEEIRVQNLGNENEETEYKCKIYKGNAYMIFVYHYEENGKKMYSLSSFFADKEHAERMLGVKKGYEKNIFDTNYDKLIKLRLKAERKETPEIAKLFAKAYKNLIIEIYSEEKEMK